MSSHAFEATAANFEPLVVANSRRGLVLVHFWSPRAAPCHLLNPRLIALADAYGGRFLLVLANVDELSSLARQWGVASVPTVKFFHHGQVVHTLHGAESEAGLRAAIDRFLPRAGNRLGEARRLFAEGDAERAYAVLAQAALDDPDDARLPLELARLMVQNGELQRAEALLRSLPEPARRRPEIEHLRTHLGLILAAQEAPEPAVLDARLAIHPDDLQARLQRAAVRLVADALEPALEDLLAIAAQAPEWRAGLGRRAVLAILALPGLEPGFIATWRSRLAQLLHP